MRGNQLWSQRISGDPGGNRIRSRREFLASPFPANQLIVMSEKKKIGILTAGGLAPCLSSPPSARSSSATPKSIPTIEIICYLGGYKGLSARREHRGHSGNPRNARIAPPLRRQPDRQQPREAHQREGLREARPRQGRPGSAEGRRRPAGQGRRGRAPHHRRRRHQHRRGRSRRRSLQENNYGLTVDRPAQDDRQRRLSRSARASAHGRPPNTARATSPTSSPSTTPTRACSSSTKSWAATAAGSPPPPPANTRSGLDTHDWLPDLGLSQGSLRRPRRLHSRDGNRLRRGSRPSRAR